MKKKAIMILSIIALLVVGAVIGIVGISLFNNKDDGNSRETNEDAEKKEKSRYLTIINDLDEIINEVHITTGEGTEIESMYQKNPDEVSFSIEIPKDFDEYDTFTITVIDRYDLKYEKVVSDVKENGRTEVKITEDDYIEQEGDWKKKIDKFFNND